MTDNDDRKWLYERMQKAGVNTGSYDDFTASMNNKEDRDWYYQKSIELGLNVGSADEFTGMMADKPSTPAQPATPAQQEEHSPYQMAQGNTPTYDYGGQMPPAQRPTKSKATSKPTQTAGAQPLGPEKFAKQMQFEQRMRQSVPSPEAMMQDFSQRMENVRKGNQPFGPNSEMRLNPDTGKMERVYYTKGGDEVATAVEQSLVNRQYDQEQKTRDDVANLSANIDSMLEAARERATEKYMNSDAVRTLTNKDKPWYKKIGAAMVTSNAPVQSVAFNTPEVQELTAAQRKLRDAKRIIAEADHNAQLGTFGDWLERSFAGGAARGFAQKATDIDTWDFGITDLLDNVSLMQALDAADKGEQLTESQQALLDATVIEMAVNTYFGSEVGRGYKAGEVTAESLPFMMEMMINPASGIGTSVGAKMTRYALKRFGKQAVKKGGERFLARKGMEIGGRVLGDVLGASTMAATTGAVRTTADAFDRMNNAQMRGEEMGYGEAFSKAFANTTIENFSEMFGAYFEPLAGVVGGGLTRVATSKVGSKIGLNRVHDFIENVGASDVARIVSDFEKHAKWNGMFGEYAEEVAGGVMNAIVVGDQTLDADPETGVFNLDQNIDTFLGVSLLGGFMSGVKTVGYRTPKYRARKAMNEADIVCRSAFENEDVNWDAIRATLSTGNVAEVKSVLQDIALNPDYTEEQKRAVMDYANKATAYKGMLIAEQKRRASGEESDEQIEAEVAFDDGYEADVESRRDIMTEAGMGEPTEARQAAADGVRQRIEDDADMEAEGWREEGRKMMHSDGSIRPAVLKVKNENGEDTEVYIVSGEVVMTADGTMVDRDRTLEANGGSTSIVIYDPATGERRMIDPTSDMGILSIGEATSAEDFEYEIQRRRDEYVQRMLDEAQGTVRVELGQSLTMPDGREGTVMAISPDGESFTVVANDGSGEVRLERSDLQQVADAAALADYQARHQEEAAEQPTEEATGEQAAVAPGIVEGAPAEFLPDMRLMVRDDDGETKEAVVQGRVRYDGGQFVPDENGQIVEYMMDGEVHHDQIPTLSNKTDGYIEAPVAVPEETEQAEGAEAVPQPTESQEQAEVQQEESTVPAGESAETATAPAAAVEPMPMRTVRRKIDGKWQDVEEEDWMSTTPASAYQYLYEEAVGLGLPIETVDNLVKSNLDNAQRGVERAKKATGSIVSVLQKQRDAQAVVDYWQQVQSLRNQQLLAEAEARDAATREERERRRAEAEAARKRDQEAYEAEMARRKAEQEKEKREQESKLEAMAKIGEESRAMGIDWPIEKDAEAMEVMNDIVPHTLEEVAAWMLGDTRGGYKIDPDAIRAHTGYGTADMKKFPFVFAKGGMSPEAFGEKIEQIARENDVKFDESDTNAGFNALLNVFGEAGSLGDLKNYIKNNRRAQAEEIHSANLRREAQAQAEDRWIAQHGGMTREEYESYINWMEDAVEQGKIAITDEEYNQLFNTDYDRGTETNDEGSDQRGAEEGSADESEAGQAAAAADDTRGDGEETEPAASPVAEAIAQQEVEENPTEGQKEAGNYKKAHVKVDGLDITIENKKGSTRSGVDPNGRAWSQTMNNNYGYILGTEGVDGDHIDMFLSDTPEQGDVFVVDQVNADGTFDEHKVMYGFPDIESARKAYLSNYEEGWQGLGAITPVSKEEFKKWVESSHRKTKPFSEYASVKTLGDVLLGENQAEEYKAPAKEEGEDVIAYAQRVADAHKAYEDKQRHRQEIDDATARVADAVVSGEREAIEKASAELERLTQAEDETLHREGDGNQTVEIPYEESLAKSKAAGYTKKQHDAMVARRWKQRIEQSKGYAERLNLGDRVTVVLSADELEAQGMTLSEEQKKDKGWYNKRTGQIFVILENNTSMDDVLKTILHEGVGHHGLRELFGKHFDQFLWNVYENADESIRGEIVELSKKHGWNTERAIEEYLARLAESENFERPELQSWWQKVKQWFLEMLHKIGFEDFNPERVITDNELRYILWRSYENLVEPDRYRSIVEEAKDIAKQWNLGVGRYEEGATTEGNRWDSEELKAAEPTAAESVVEGIEEVNARFNEELERYGQGSMSSNEHLTIGEPMGKLADYMPNRTIILRQKVLTKALKKHGLDVASIKNLPEALANPIFVFQSTPNTISVLTELQDNNGKNVFVAIELDTAKQLGHEFLEVNDVLTIHGREEENIIKPIIENNSLLWADKEKGHRWLSSVKSNSQAITNDDLLSAAKVIKDFDTAKNNSQDADILHRNGEENVAYMEKVTELLLRLASGNEASAAQKMSAYRAIGGNLASLRKAMSLQKEFDKGTVQRVTDLATSLISHGMLDNMKASEVSRLLSAVKNSTAKENIKGGLNTVMDILIDSQLRRAEEMLHKLESVRGSKVDAKGVQVQGQLDIAGQRMVDTFKKARGWQKEAIEEKMANAEERMGSEDTVEAEEAALEFAGLQLAHDYIEKIQASEMAEEDLYKAIRDDEKKVYTYTEEPVLDADGKPMLKKDGELMKRTVRHTKPEFKAPMSEENKRIKQQVKEFVAATEESIRHGKTERLQDYMELIGRLSGSMRESMANAKAWKEEQKERVREIQHNANSDMEGTPSNAHYEAKWKDKLANNSFVQFLLSPLGTFDQMLRMFGSKSANGDGYLWNRFMRGWVDARQQEIRGVRSKFAVLDSKAKEVFGDGVKSWGDLIRRVGKLPKMTVGFWDGGEMRDHELTQGNLMYIYMVDKMSDGRMKLRHMGVTEEAVEAITKILDPRLKRLADWMQGEFLADTRKEYNETHKRMFGASMAEIEDYFPLKILANARNDNPETLDNPDMKEGISTKTGSIIKRTANTLDLDLLNADALNVILDHVAQMEHWNAYAEFNRDLNTLRTYKHFRNQVQNMTTVYGSGKELWKRFNDVCQMAAGTYRPPRAKLDTVATNMAKGVTAAKVSLRIYTALKQFLSMPAYIPDARPDLWVKNLATPWKSWNWAIEKLPIFEERWKSRMAGDPRLLKTEMDWKAWRNNVVQMASKIGMSPNAFVDALTVSIGARTIYETRKARYIKEGYGEEKAEKRAMQDAEVLYNETQQSSEGAFLSTMQVDRSWLSVMFTVFRNSSMAYQRQLHDALRNLKRDLFKKGNRKKSIEFMAKQMVREGIGEEQAMINARERYNRQMGKDALRVATFGFIVELAWNLGGLLPYLLFGDDDDKKKEMMDDVWARSMFGWGEGLTGGDVFSQAGQMLVQGEGNPEYLKKEMPITSDAYNILSKVNGGKWGEVVNDVVNLAVQIGVGVNPQSITDAVLAMTDICGGDLALTHEALIAVARVLQVPQSQIESLYFDEFGINGKEVSNYTAEELVERYAEYRVRRGYVLTPFGFGEEKEEKKANERKRGKGKLKERVEHMDEVQREAVFDRDDDVAREMVFGQEKKEHGVSASTGNYKSKGGKRYNKMRDYVDMAEDVLFRELMNDAKTSGDEDMLRDVKETEKYLKRMIKNLGEADEDVAKAIMEDYRKERKMILEKYSDRKRDVR